MLRILIMSLSAISLLFAFGNTKPPVDDLSDTANVASQSSATLPEAACKEIDELGTQGLLLITSDGKSLLPSEPRVEAINLKAKVLASKFSIDISSVQLAMVDNGGRKLARQLVEEIVKQNGRPDGSISKDQFVKSISNAAELSAADREELARQLNESEPRDQFFPLKLKLKYPPKAEFCSFSRLPDIAHLVYERWTNLKEDVVFVKSCAGGCLDHACFYCPLCRRAGGVLTCDGDQRCNNCVVDQYSHCYDRTCCFWCIAFGVWHALHV
jgi:hypothetical protein